MVYCLLRDDKFFVVLSKASYINNLLSMFSHNSWIFSSFFFNDFNVSLLFFFSLYFIYFVADVFLSYFLYWIQKKQRYRIRIKHFFVHERLWAMKTTLLKIIWGNWILKYWMFSFECMVNRQYGKMDMY